MAHVWARVTDKVTGHQYDVTLDRLQALLDRGAPVEEVPGRRHHGGPRPAKLQRPLATLAPQPTKRAAKPPAEAVETKESESA